MSANSKQVKNRINSVKNIAKMTKTMEMVSSAKMKKALAKVVAGRPYAEGVLKLLVKLKHQRGLRHELFRERKQGKELYVIIGSDRGLCGGYNSRIERLVREKVSQGDVDVITLGKKITQKIRRTKPPVMTFQDLTSETSYREIQNIGKQIENLYIQDRIYKKVSIVHTLFTSAMSPTVILAPILPLELDSLMAVHDVEKETFLEKDPSVPTLEPHEEVVVNRLVPDLFRGILYQFVLESYASEQALRMAAMKQATDNAKELEEELFYQYNRARQAAVTQEITEIMNTSAALS